jgi:hypothetical protein
MLVTCIGVCSPAAGDEQAAVAIERVQWGFDGKAQERTFVPLSVLLRNTSPLEFEGTLTLTKLVQTTKPIDAGIEQQVYLGPLSSRWVQFAPYVIGDWEQWRLNWKHDPQDHHDVPTPQVGEPATVLLYDPEDLQVAGGVLRRFPIPLFPVSVTATDGLRGIAMDRVPRWQGARRDAFLDWLRLGGRIYLLQDEQGRFPRFPESMAVLNGSGDRFMVGAGIVQRLGHSVRGLEPDFVKEQILSDPLLSPLDERYQQYRQSPHFPGTALSLSRRGWDRDTQMFLDLQSLSRFARQWWVIYLLSLVYLFTLFPICYRVGREARDYRWMYVVLLGNVIVFSWGFASLSRLGASELSRARSVAMARQLSDGLYDVTQWTCVGVRSAGDYTIAHEGTGRLYTTSQELERIDGRIVAGPSGRIELTIPPASTRSILHRSRLQAQPLGLSVLGSSADERGLAALSVEVGEGFPDSPDLILAAYQGVIYELRRVQDQLVLMPSSRKPLSTFLSELTNLIISRVGFSAFSGRGSSEFSSDDEIFDQMIRTLVGNSFGLADKVDLAKLTLPPDIVRIFVYAPQPETFRIEGEAIPDQKGHVMYCVDLSLRGPRVRLRSPAPSAGAADSPGLSAQPEAQSLEPDQR